MASGGMIAKLRKRRGKKVTIDGEEFIIRGHTMNQLRIVDDLRKAGANGTEEEKEAAIRYSTAAWYGFVLCEDTDGTLVYPKQDGESDLDWAKRIEPELSEIDNSLLQAISAKVAKINDQPTDAVIVKN